VFQVFKNSEVYNNKPLVYGFFEEQSSVLIDEKINNDIIDLFNQDLIKKEVGSINKIYTFKKLENSVIYLVGLGKLSTYSIGQLEKALVNVNYKLGDELNINLASFLGKLDPKDVAKALVNCIGNYNYAYDELLTKKFKNDLTINIIAEDNLEIDLAIKEGFNLAIAMNNVRDLVNKPYNYLNAADLALYAEELVEDLDNNKLSIKVYNKKEIEALGMNAFLGVNKGSTAEPKLIHIKYNGGSGDYIGLIGKGVMFDTGGYSIKTNMLNMKDDMAGSATVLGVLEAVVKNNIPVNLQVVICATDNRINGEALLPDDVLTAMNKTTIEIKSTDAEGRLTLADGICFAQKEGCKELIDIATLTGAVVVALGDDVTGLFGNDEENIKKLLAASKEANEDFWHMPITDRIREEVRSSKVADLTNSTGRNMGASSAAAFLEAFVEEGTKWMHLDIAGTAFTTSPRAGQFYGATAVALKTLYNYLKNKNA
jgi:leucyl aminopeptidase